MNRDFENPHFQFTEGTEHLDTWAALSNYHFVVQPKRNLTPFVSQSNYCHCDFAM